MRVTNFRTTKTALFAAGAVAALLYGLTPTVADEPLAQDAPLPQTAQQTAQKTAQKTAPPITSSDPVSSPATPHLRSSGDTHSPSQRPAKKPVAEGAEKPQKSAAAQVGAVPAELRFHRVGKKPRALRTLEYLSSEPVTLLDLGIQRLQHDLVMVGRELHQRGVVPVPPVTGAYFEWRQAKIIVYLTARERFGEPQEGYCVELFEQVAAHLGNRARGQSGNVSWYLESLFSHEGVGNWEQPKNLQRDLMETVQLEVTLLSPDLMRGKRVNCAGRLDADAEDVRVTVS